MSAVNIHCALGLTTFFPSAIYDHKCAYLSFKNQRWASTLANRSNARHRSNIRAPHAPLPRCMYPKCGNLCCQRGRKRFRSNWGLRMSHICPCTPSSPPGYRSKVKSRHFAHLCQKLYPSAIDKCAMVFILLLAVAKRRN
jgi:hypothetical protein